MIAELWNTLAEGRETALEQRARFSYPRHRSDALFAIEGGINALMPRRLQRSKPASSARPSRRS